MKHIHLLLLLVLAAALVTPLAAAPPTGRPAPVLEDDEIEVLVDTAVRMRAGLAELRELKAAPENAARRAEIVRNVGRDFTTFLETAGLTKADFVRLLDQDGGLSNGKDDGQKPQLRILEKVER